MEPARTIATRELGAPARLTRAIFFDKPPGRNWHLELHQDLTIAVAERRDDAIGFGPWSTKHGVCHCEAPAKLLRQMVTVRIHFDDADESNGCLLAAPLPADRSNPKLSADAFRRLAALVEPMVATAGDAVVMRPLVPHASGRNTTEHHRRVLHMEFTGEEPGGGLRWRDEAEILGQGPTRP